MASARLPKPNLVDIRFTEYRRAAIRAIAADDELANLLVLKGGNALRLVHEIGARTSQDIDYSMESDFPDFDRARERLKRAFEKEFVRLGLHVVEFRAEFRPESRGNAKTADGYRIAFKLATQALLESHPDGDRGLGARTEAVGPNFARAIEVQISKHERCGAAERRDFDGYPLLVYAPDLIAAEKLRALCQQMDEYPRRSRKRPRSRDLYDIHAIVQERGVRFETPAFLELVNTAFAAKMVPIRLLSHFAAYREFHRGDWVAIQGTVPADLRDFDFYFDFVLAEIAKLQPLRMVDAP